MTPLSDYALDKYVTEHVLHWPIVPPYTTTTLSAPYAVDYGDHLTALIEPFGPPIPWQPSLHGDQALFIAEVLNLVLYPVTVYEHAEDWNRHNTAGPKRTMWVAHRIGSYELDRPAQLDPDSDTIVWLEKAIDTRDACESPARAICEAAKRITEAGE